MQLEQIAARALARGEALGALAAVGRLDTPLALTMRGIAYAQMGDRDLARESLRRALAIGSDPLVLARARAALVELGLDDEDPEVTARDAIASSDELLACGDVRNAAMQRLVAARAEVLRGRLGAARAVVGEVKAEQLPSDVRAVLALASAEIAIRGLVATEARRELARARMLLSATPHALLGRALVALEAELVRPIARLVRRGLTSPADLLAIEDAAQGDELLVDACRCLCLAGRAVVPLSRRPVLFSLLLALARGTEARDALVTEAFAVRRPNASHRQRLRVEIGRLRKALGGLGAAPVATTEGYRLASSRPLVVLLPPTDDEGARIALLLGDGAAWTARSLAAHAGVSRSTAQRTLRALVDGGTVTRLGQGRDLRYVRTGPPVASRMLLLGLVPPS